VVQLQLEGQKALQEGLDALKKSVEAFSASFKKLGEEMTKSLDATKTKTTEATATTIKLGDAFKTLGTQINLALGAGIAVVGNFVRQGLSMGAMGQLLQFQMQRLSLTMSGLFRPEIEKITQLIGKLTNWINNLTSAQKAAIAHWIQGAAAALAVAVIMPRIVTGIQAVIGAVHALGAAVGLLEAETGIGAILPIVGLLVEGLTMLMVGTDAGREALKEMWDATKELGAAFMELFKAMDLGDVLDSMVEGFVIVIKLVADLVRWTAELIKKLNELSDGKFAQFLKAGLLALAGPLAILGDLSKQINGPRAKKDENRDQEMKRLGGPESFQQTYARIAQASLMATGGKGAKSPEERTADATEIIAQNTGGIYRQGQTPPTFIPNCPDCQTTKTALCLGSGPLATLPQSRRRDGRIGALKRTQSRWVGVWVVYPHSPRIGVERG
jgi:hypothetical protein